MEPLKIISRDVWHANDPKSVKPMNIPVPYVFVIYTKKFHCHNLKTCVTQLNYLQDRHMNSRLKAPDICYNFLISDEGVVYEGRGWTNQPTLPLRFSHIQKQSMFLAFMGTYKNGAPGDASLTAKTSLIEFGVKNHLIDPKHIEVFFASNEPALFPTIYHEYRTHKRVVRK